MADAPHISQPSLTAQDVPAWVSENVAIRDKVYYHIGGIARYWAEPTQIKEVACTLSWAKSQNLPLLVLGKGTNTLVGDHAFPGIILSTSSLTRATWLAPDLLWAEAGLTNTEIATLAQEKNRSGAEWMYRLPGSLGATVRMNARCFGGEISEVVPWVVAMGMTGELRTYSGKDVFLGYKETHFMKSPEIVLGAFLLFPTSSSQEAIWEKMKHCEDQRNAKHHFDFPSCGSTFLNNRKNGAPSGQIFDQLGLKGYQVGGARVSDHHANFIYNVADATAEDVLNVASHMKTQAENAGYTVELEMEPMGVFRKESLKNCGLRTHQAHDEENDEIPKNASNSEVWLGVQTWPSPREPLQIAAYPRVILQGPLFSYGLPGSDSRLLLPQQLEAFVTLSQVQSLEQASKNPLTPFLEWQVTARGSLQNNGLENLFPHIPPEDSPYFQDGLWEWSVAELFLSAPDTTFYLEFEMTANNRWLALSFKDVRKRDKKSQTPQASDWPGTQLFKETGPDGQVVSFGMTLSYSVLRPIIGAQGSLKATFAAHFGRKVFGIFPPWESLFEKPDFHQPAKYFPIQLL